MELKNLHTFQTVVKEGSYQRAAQVLGYTQSTITAQIQQLERELGYPLFQRMGRRMVLTQVGARALEEVSQVLLAAQRLRQVGTDSAALTGTLRVDMAETLLCYHMQPVIRTFRQQAPQVRLILRSSNCSRIAENLRDGLCDLGVGYDMGWEQEYLQLELLGWYDLVLLASPQLKDTDFITPHQRKAVSLIIDEPDSLFRLSIERYLRERDIQLEETVELWSIETIRRCVISNLGVTFLPRFVVEEDLAAGRLVELPASIPGIRPRALCARHKNTWVSPAMTLFQNLLREHVGTADRNG